MDWIFSVIGLGIGAGLGLAALLKPKWASNLVRLSERAPGGAAEFRATYGGLLLFAHLAGLYLVRVQWLADDVGIQAMAVGAIAVLGAGWFGSAIGRLISMWRDKTATRMNWFNVAFEAGMGALISAPWLVWFFGSVFR